MKIKNIAVCLLVLILLCIPTYVAIADYKASQKSPIADSTVSSVKIVNPEGVSYEPDNFSMFIDLIENGKALSEFPDEMKSVEPCTVTYNCLNGGTYDYKFYFTTDTKDCIYTDYNDKVYRVSENNAEQFLMSDYSVYLYTGAVQPCLSVNGTVILPSKMNWTYITYGDVERTLDCDVDSQKATLATTKGVELKFDVEPDVVTVEVTENGDTTFSGLYENFVSDYKVKEGSNISVTLNVKWNEDLVSKFSYGEAIYLFDVSVLPAPVFTLGESTITAGEFVCVTAENVLNASDIKFTSEPALDFTPTFTDMGGYSVALIPISYLNEYSPEYNFTFTYADYSKTLKLEVTEKNYKTVELPTSAATLNAYRTTSSINEYNEILENYLKSSSSEKYFSGSFGEGSTNSLTILMGFGLKVSTETGETYRNDGVDFGYADETQTASAVNDGVVVYVGNLTYCGNIVIVDHGLGLMSTYTNLSQTTVTVGQRLAKGDVIGNLGKTGCTDIVRLHVGLYVYGVPVQPYSLWADGDDKEVIIYNPQNQVNE